LAIKQKQEVVMKNAVPEYNRPPSESFDRAVATASRVCDWRYNPALSRHLQERVSCDERALTLYEVASEEDYYFGYSRFERADVLLAKGYAVRSPAILATFSVTGEVTVRSGRERCVHLLIPCLVVASIVFPQASYEVVWKSPVPSTIWLQCGKFLRLHRGGVDWQDEARVCKAQNGRLLVDSASLSERIRFRDMYSGE
jgi:hypothetical protein